MRSRRSTVITLIAVGSGLVVLLVAGMMLRKPTREQWYVSRLTSRDARTRDAAAERLGEMGSVKAIPHLMRAFSTTVGALENEAGTGPFAQMKNLYAQQARRSLILSNLGGASRGGASRVANRQVVVRSTSSSRRTITTLRSTALRSAVDARVEALAEQVFDSSARALVKIAKESGDAALPRLLLELKSDSWEIRWLAVCVLDELDSEDAAAAIRSMTTDPNEHVRYAANAAKARRDQSGEDPGPGAPQPVRRARRGF